MNWLSNSVTNCMVVWGYPGQPMTCTVHMGGAAHGSEEVGEVSVLPRPQHCRLRSEITGPPGKSLASVWDTLKLMAQHLPLRPSRSQSSQGPAQTGVVTTYTHLEKEGPGCQAGCKS